MSEPCLFPNLAPSTSYDQGCRCIGCIDGMRIAWKKRKARNRRGEKSIPPQRSIHNQEWVQRTAYAQSLGYPTVYAMRQEKKK